MGGKSLIFVLLPLLCFAGQHLDDLHIKAKIGQHLDGLKIRLERPLYGEDPIQGVWTVSGTDSQLGTYSGQVEFRKIPEGYQFIRTILYDSAYFEGYRIASAWSGNASIIPGKVSISVELLRQDFIYKYGQLERTEADKDPMPVVGEFAFTDDSNITGTYTSPQNPQFLISETMTYQRPIETEPIFKIERWMKPSHNPPTPGMKAFLFWFFQDMHKCEDVIPYVDREEFQEAIHYWFYDRTDFNYYRNNRDKLRVVNKVIDDISLAETKRRALAFGPTIEEKARFFEENTEKFHINSLGMVVGYEKGSDPPIYYSDGDSDLWTGTYIASQAMRYKVTGEQKALDNLLHSLNGLFICCDIPQEPGQFARTIRPYNSPGEKSTEDDLAKGEWIRGTGPYADIDWLSGGNNDMLHGIVYGFLWASLAVPKTPEYQHIHNGIAKRTMTLARHNEVANNGRSIDMNIQWLAWLLTGRTEFWEEWHQIWDAEYMKLWLEAGGDGTHIQGISDWSGLHLGIISLLLTNILAQETQDPRIDLCQLALRKGVMHLKGIRHGLWFIAANALGNFQGNEGKFYLHEGIWVMREILMPKLEHNIDHRIKPSWCMSPYPSLFWYMDWKLPGHRRQGIYAYPNFERPSTDTLWTSNYLTCWGSESSREPHSVDFLHAYWMLRYYNIMPDDMGTP